MGKERSLIPHILDAYENEEIKLIQEELEQGTILLSKSVGVKDKMSRIYLSITELNRLLLLQIQ